MSYQYRPRTADRGSAIRYRLLVGLLVAIFAVLSSWLALVIVTRIDEIFTLGGIDVGGLTVLPGVDEVESEGLAGRTNILVMGLDRRPTEGKTPTRTDSMFVMTINPATDSAGILNIPRDLWVEIPYPDQEGYFQSKINSAFVTGATQGYDEGGPGLVKRVLEDNLGITIDHYILIDFEAFIEVIDDLGGVDVDVPDLIDDPYYSETEKPGEYTPLYIEPGVHHFDGQMALNYARTRYGNSDLDRIRRQQLIIFAALDQALSLNLITKGPELWARYKDSIETDINDLQVPGFAAGARGIDPDQVYALSLGWATVDTNIEGQSALVADPALVEQLVSALFSDQGLSEEAALVEIQNGSATDGLAAQVVDYLARIGFAADSLTTANTADGVAHPRSEIVDFTGKPSTSQRLAAALGIPPEHVRQAGPEDGALRSGQPDIVVILGSDAQAERFAPRPAGGG